MSYPDTEGFQPPPPPPLPEAPTGPVMSTAETLTGIFFEPGRVFESLRARPRFLVAGLIVIILSMVFTALFFQRVGYENSMRAVMEKSPRGSQMSPEQREQAVAFYQKPVIKALTYCTPLLIFPIAFVIGAALYLLGTMAVGQKISFQQALSVWVYSNFPPAVLTMLLNILILFLKSPDDIDPGQLRSGLIKADLGILVDEKAAPVLASLLGSIDLFAFYGLFLAALGLRKVANLKRETAWGIVLTIWIIRVILRIIWATAFGSVAG
jgi:hypothetical protein